MVNKNLLSFIKEEWKYIFISTILSAAETVAIILECWFIAGIVNHIFLLEGTLQDVSTSFFILFVVIALRLASDYFSEYFAEISAASIQTRIRQRIISQIDSLSPIQLKNETSTQIIHLFTDGVDRFKDWYAYYFPYLIKVVITPVIYLLFAFPADYISAFIMVFTLPLIPIFMILIGTWTKKVSERQWTLVESLTGYLKDVLQGLETLKLLGRSKAQANKIQSISERYRHTTLAVQKWAFTSALALELISTLSIAIIAVNLGIRLISGHIDFFDAFFILLIIPEYYFPMRRLGGFFHSSLDADAAEKTLSQFLDLKTERGSFGEEYLGEINQVSFKNVSYKYPGSDHYAVKNISFELNKGDSVALVGASGSGKTTILALALGFLEPESGEILINGTKKEYLSQDDYLTEIAYIPQRPHFLKASIYENIGFGDGEYSKSKIEKMLASIQGRSIFSALDDGFNTMIGQDGIHLSGGQEELVAFLRALYEEKDVFFLDEATESLDVATEKSVIEILSDILQTKTALIIAHRLSTIKNVDHILCLDNGELVDQGTFQELQNTSRLFKSAVQEGENQ